MNDHLCQYEWDLLSHCAGDPMPGLTWGAAMSVALESLESEGLIARSGGAYAVTQKGLAELAKRKAQP